jgi:hypothetical protein
MATAVQTRNKSPIKLLALGLMAGSAVGIAITSLVARRGPVHKAVAMTTDDEDLAAPKARGQANHADMPAPRLAALEPQAPPAGAGDPAVEQRRVTDMVETQLQAHRLEPTDAAWAAPASRSISADFNIMQGRRGFKVNGVNCRSHTCTADLEWPSRDLASSEWSRVLHYPYRNGCAKMLVLSPSVPGQESGPAKTTMLFDCAERKGQPDVDIAPPEEYAQNAPAPAPSPPSPPSTQVAP